MTDITLPRAKFEAVKDALAHARNIAMEQTMKAHIPECGEFGAIAQNLDWVLNVALAHNQQIAENAYDLLERERDHAQDFVESLKAELAEAQALNEASRKQPVAAWWIPKAEQFCLQSKSGERPFAKAWEPLYATPVVADDVSKERDQLQEHVKELEKLSVTNIMVDVAPGDGSGLEVYAKTIADVEKLLIKLSEKADSYDLETVPLRQQLYKAQALIEASRKQVGTVIEVWNGHDQGTNRVVNWLDENYPPAAGTKLYAAPVVAPDVLEKYNELIYAVHIKFPNETRHETALRYIKRMEEPATTSTAKAMGGAND